MSPKRKVPTERQCVEVAGLLKNLAHPQRLAILCHLCEGAKTVGELEALSGASQSAVSQFLTRMRGEGLVNSERQGQNVVYDIADVKVKKLIESLYRIYCD